MVNGIGSYNNYMSCLQTQTRSRPDPAEMFKNVDVDGSGGVSESELETFVQNISSKTGNSIDTAGAVSTYDADGDGELSEDELKTFMEANMPPPPGGRMGMGGKSGPGGLFEALDADSSGGVSQSELDKWAEAMSGETGNSIDTADAVSTYDTDGDGVLNADELKSFMKASGVMPPPPPPGGAGMMGGVGFTGESSTTSAKNIISEYDTDADGVLSTDELQGYLDDEDTASFMTLVQQALSAYTANFGSGRLSNVEDALFNFGGSNGYSPVDLLA